MDMAAAARQVATEAHNEYLLSQDTIEDKVLLGVEQWFKRFAELLEKPVEDVGWVESDEDKLAHAMEKYCGKSSCPRCNTYPTPE